MLDGYISAHEEEALIDVAVQLGLQRDQLTAIHATYLDGMAISAWEDGVVTEPEAQLLLDVASMLGLPSALVLLALERAHGRTLPGAPKSELRPGDQVVFTGAMSVPRDAWIARAEAVGLIHGGVSKRTKVVVAADPDSLSGKAGKAREYGVPVVTEAAFERMLATLRDDGCASPPARS